MKNCFIQIILFTFLCVCTSCKSKESKTQFEAKPIVKSVGKIDVMVDPNVEMMMILGRLGNVVPFGKNEWNKHEYLDRVDEFFKEYTNHNGVLLISNNMAYHRIPEFGMYLKDDMSDFIMQIDDENFVTMDGPAKNISYYKSKKYLEAIRDFRIESGFDKFFLDNTSLYESKIYKFITLLEKVNLTEWLEDFYGEKLESNIKLSLTYLGGNFGINFRTSDKKQIPHTVIFLNERESDFGFTYLLSHEYSHPKTTKIVEELHKNEKIQEKFASIYNNNSRHYSMNGYPSGFYVLNETINQACANKFWENLLEKDQKDILNNHTTNNLKLTLVPQIAEFFDNYQNNRDKYKTLEDFIPELEEFILTLE